MHMKIKTMNLAKLTVWIIVAIQIFHFGAGETIKQFKGNCSNYTVHVKSLDLNWKISRELCKMTGQDLVSIESDAEWIFLKNTILKWSIAGEYFIGLKMERSGKWRWLSNKRTSQTRLPWVPGQPSGDGHCATMHIHYGRDYGKYNDFPCGGPQQRPGYICELPVDSCDQEGISDGDKRCSCYTFESDTAMSWTRAEDFCKYNNKHLVAMETEREWEFINKEIQTRKSGKENEWHIGLNRDFRTRKWTWVNGKPLTIDKWEDGEPRHRAFYTLMAKEFPIGFKGSFYSIEENVNRGWICEEETGITIEKEHKGLTSMGITIVSALGSVVFIVVAALAAVLFKTHRAGRNPNIPDGANEEEITPYATVGIPLNAENNGSGFPGNHDIPLKTLPFQLTAPTEERAAGRTELRNSPYENIDHLGGSSVTPLEYLLYQPRYQNEAVDNETRAGVMIRPGYDKLTPATRKKRRENGGEHLGQRLPCGMVDTHCLSEYDSLIWETDLRCKSRRGDITDSKSEDNMNIHTILGVPSCDEGSPPCSMDRRRNQGNSLGDTQFGCIENDWKTSDV